MEYKISNGSLTFVKPSIKDLEMEVIEDPNFEGIVNTPYDGPKFFTMYILVENEH